MENDNNRDYGQKDRNPQERESQLERDNNESKNGSDAEVNSQRSPENGRDSNRATSSSERDRNYSRDSESGINRNNEYQDTKDSDNEISNPDDFDEVNTDNAVDDNKVIPSERNPQNINQNHTEKDDLKDSKYKSNDSARTPGL